MASYFPVRTIDGRCKALGESEAGARHVVTVPGRGYSFVAPLATGPAPPVAPATLPLRLQPVEGREADIDLVAGRLRQHRFVSIIGAGGIGKTTVALSVARRFVAETAETPLFIDLGAMTDGALATAQVLAALERRDGGERGPAGGPRLVLLDNGDPVIGAAAVLAERILRAHP